jgi:hypothetical protein
VLFLVGTGCAGFRPEIEGTPCPVAWASIGSIDESAASLRVRLRLRVRGEEVATEIVVERRDGELIVVGLAQYGTRLFTVRQRDVGSEVETRVRDASSRELEQVALWVMDALHRVYWIHPPTDLREDGHESFERAGERVVSTREEGTLRREIALEDPAAGRVTIEYPDAAAGPLAKRVAIRNPWCGYEAVMVLISTPSSDPSRARGDFESSETR